MRQRATLLHVTLTACLILVTIGGAAAGPLEDAREAYGQGDYATAYRLFRPLADQGNATAQTNLGVMYGNGQGLPQSYAEALKWSKGRRSGQCRRAVQPRPHVSHGPRCAAELCPSVYVVQSCGLTISCFKER